MIRLFIVDTLTFDLPTVWAHKARAFNAQRLYGRGKYKALRILQYASLEWAPEK